MITIVFINLLRNVIISLYFVTDFFPYNESNGDERLPNADDFSYGPRKLKVPVNFFNTLEFDLYVSGNECYYKMVVFTFICEYRYRLMDSFHFKILFLHFGPSPSQKVSLILMIL